jgi:hypothetical protein
VSAAFLTIGLYLIAILLFLIFMIWLVWQDDALTSCDW